MLKIIGILFLGIAAGYLFRKHRWTERVSSGTTATVAVLLFIMGCETGGSEDIMKSIVTLGGEGILIGLAATAGSVLAAFLLYRAAFRKKEESGHEK